MNAQAEHKGGSEKAVQKSPVHRSPNYPAFTLEVAIKKAKILWDKDHKVGAHKDIVLQHLGYTTESGTALRTLATLKRFDLTTEKDGRIIVSQKALDILLYPNDDPRHKDALKHAALNPSVYNDLYNKYKWAFPSDETLKAELIREYSFNPKQVTWFLTDFRETLKYAELDRPSHDQAADEEHIMTRETQPAVFTNVRPETGSLQMTGGPSILRPISYSVPLKKQNEATLSFKKFPLEKADLQLIKSWLELMEENLTEQPVEDVSDLI